MYVSGLFGLPARHSTYGRAQIILAAIPIMKPQCSLAQSALMNFKAACRLYDEGAASVRHPNMVVSSLVAYCNSSSYLTSSHRKF